VQQQVLENRAALVFGDRRGPSLSALVILYVARFIENAGNHKAKADAN